MNQPNETVLAIRPSLLSGFEDILPSRMIPLQRIIDQIKQVYESFGFVPLETPGMERREVLIGTGEDFNKSIYATRIIKGAEDAKEKLVEEDAALRFDLTLPLARVVAAYSELPRPFKRYQIGKVWRGERPQLNRYREFTQFDVDIIGSRSVVADVEIVQIIEAVLKKLGLKSFLIRINDRRILDGLAEVLGCSDKKKELERIIDKIDDLKVEGVIKELCTLGESAFSQKLVLTEGQAQKLEEFLRLRAASSAELLDEVERFFENKSDQAREGITTLRAMKGILDRIGVSDEFWKFDLSVARGLDYYSGPVFETSIPEMPEVGSIFSGGRFDGLTNRFIQGSNIAGVGASIGISRLMTVLEKTGLIQSQVSLTKVLVPIFNETFIGAALVCANTVRSYGIPTEIYLGQETSLRAQITYAVKQGMSFALILGPDEIRDGKVSLRNLESRSQVSLTLEEAIATMCKSLI